MADKIYSAIVDKAPAIKDMVKAFGLVYPGGDAPKIVPIDGDLPDVKERLTNLAKKLYKPGQWYTIDEAIIAMDYLTKIGRDRAAAGVQAMIDYKIFHKHMRIIKLHSK